jgi:iron-sulfur cluster assembly accessory protein
MQAPITPDATDAQPTGELLHLTDTAIEMARAAIAREGGESAGLRVGVVGGGCSGMSYHMAVEPGPRSDDEVFELAGIRIFINAESRQYLNGVTLDYVTGLHGAGFKFQNPNASRTCGCGSSFAT